MQLIKFSLVILTCVAIGNVRSGLNEENYEVTRAQATSPDNWAQQNYPTVLNMVLPGGEIPLAQFPTNVKWMATVRILPPFGKPEYRFSMQRFYDGRVEVSATKPTRSSILSQLQTLRLKYPDDSLQKIAALIALDKQQFTQSKKPELAAFADKFERISMSPVLPAELRVDDTGYEFWSQSLWGNRMNLTLGGPGAGSAKQPHALLEWAESVRSVIDGSAERN